MNKQKIATLKNEILNVNTEIEFVPFNYSYIDHSQNDDVLIEFLWEEDKEDYRFSVDSNSLNNAIVEAQNGEITLKDTDGNEWTFHLFNKTPKKILVDW